MGFDEDLTAPLLGFADVIEPRIPELIEGFTKALERDSELREVFPSGPPRELPARVLPALLSHLLTGRCDQEFAESREEIGRRMAEFGVPEDFQFRAITHMRALLSRILCEACGSRQRDAQDAIEALGRRLDLGLMLTQRGYSQTRAEAARTAGRRAVLEQQRALLDQMREVSELINATAGGEEVLDRLALDVAGLTGMEIVAVERYDPSERRFRLLAQHGLQETAASVQAPIAATLFGIGVGESRRILAAASDPEFETGLAGELELDALFCAPVRAGREVLGAVTLASRRRPEMDASVSASLNALAAHLGAAWQASELAHRKAEKSRLETLARESYVLAHEVRNPLNNVILQAAVMRRQIQAVDEPLRLQMERGLSVVEEETRRLTALVEEYLVLGQYSSQRERIGFGDFVGRILRGYEIAFEEGKIVVEKDLDVPDLWVEIDPVQFSQVLHNLIRNALDVLDEGGRLGLHCRRVDDRVELDVIDSGPGVEHPESAFNFFSTTKEHGTGLGLAVAREIARSHGGELELLSGSRPGAEFRLSLPLAD
jgi:signal transduction histidine kinase